MEKRTLTISLQPDWQETLRTTTKKAFQRQRYMGEALNFDSPAAFFSQLSEKRWALVRLLQEAGELPVRELARRAQRDIKRVHEDSQALVTLGIFEKSISGGLICPYSDIHVDMHLQRAA